MKLAGIVRRIDELGRIVVPKEIRKTLHIKNGENLEIFIDDNKIILKKYSELGNMQELSDTITETLNSTLKASVLISDTDKYISISGPLKNKYLNDEISETILKYINNRKTVILKDKSINLTKDKSENENIFISPIISSGDVVGSIIVISKKELNSSNIESITLISNILAKHIES